MSYPNFKNKHLEEALFTSEEFIDFAHKTIRTKFPKKWIITFQRHAEGFIKRKFKLRRIKKAFLAGNVYLNRNVGLIKIGGIGSPHACTVFEELIALGGTEFVIIGTAGGLQKRGLFICNRAIRDEGTSSHYLKHSKYAYPHNEFTNKLQRFLDSKNLKVESGTSWTIDAPYRETKAEIAAYKKEGVVTVEMESSAMFSVAKCRGVKIAAIFSVSDLVGGGAWEPEFDKKHYKINFHKAIVAAYEYLSKN